MRKFYQGYYKCVNPEKYKGNPNQIVYRSGWEFKYCRELDNNPDIIKWSSEEIPIPYISPKDQKYHRYYVDFWIKKKFPDGKVKEYLVEIKPKKETLPPKKGKRVSKNFINEVITYSVNQAKWESAQKYCKQMGWNFVILTEDELKI